MPTGRPARIEDDRPRAFPLQCRVDVPDQLFPLLLDHFARLSVKQILERSTPPRRRCRRCRNPAFRGDGGNRRIFLVATSSGEGLLTERRAAAQSWRRELAFMPADA